MDCVTCCYESTTVGPNLNDQCICDAPVGSTVVDSAGNIYIRTTASIPCQISDWELLGGDQGFNISDGGNTDEILLGETILYSSPNSSVNILVGPNEVQFQTNSSIIPATPVANCFASTTVQGALEEICSNLTTGFDITDGTDTSTVLPGETLTFDSPDDSVIVNVNPNIDTVLFSTNAGIIPVTPVLNCFTSTNVQDALEEICANVVGGFDLSDGTDLTTIMPGETLTVESPDGSVVVNLTPGVDVLQLSTNASLIPFNDPGNCYTGVTVEAALQELCTQMFIVTDGTTPLPIGKDDTITVVGDQGVTVVTTAPGTVTVSGPMYFGAVDPVNPPDDPTQPAVYVNDVTCESFVWNPTTATWCAAAASCDTERAWGIGDGAGVQPTNCDAVTVDDPVFHRGTAVRGANAITSINAQLENIENFANGAGNHDFTGSTNVIASGSTHTITNSNLAAAIGSTHTITNSLTAGAFGGVANTITDSNRAVVVGGANMSVTNSFLSGALAGNASSITNSIVSTVIGTSDSQIVGVAPGSHQNALFNSHDVNITSAVGAVTGVHDSSIISSTTSTITGDGPVGTILNSGASTLDGTSLVSTIIGSDSATITDGMRNGILISTNSNITNGTLSTLIGVQNSSISDSTNSFIAGGNNNQVIGTPGGTSHSGAIVGGHGNLITGNGGAAGPRDAGIFSSIGSTIMTDNTGVAIIGGITNTAVGLMNGSVLAGGNLNTNNSSARAVILGGQNNNVTTSTNAVVGGLDNTVTNATNTFVYGSNLTVNAPDNSWVGGMNVNATNNSVFVWNGTPNVLAAPTASQVLMAATNGYTFFTNNAFTTGVTAPAGTSAWVAVSSQDYKTEIPGAIDAVDILDVLSNLHVFIGTAADNPDRHFMITAEGWNLVIDGAVAQSVVPVTRIERTFGKPIPVLDPETGDPTGEFTTPYEDTVLEVEEIPGLNLSDVGFFTLAASQRLNTLVQAQGTTLLDVEANVDVLGNDLASLSAAVTLLTDKIAAIEAILDLFLNRRNLDELV